MQVNIIITNTSNTGAELSELYNAVAGVTVYANNAHYHVLAVNKKKNDDMASLCEVLFLFDKITNTSSITHHFTNKKKIIFFNTFQLNNQCEVFSSAYKISDGNKLYFYFNEKQFFYPYVFESTKEPAKLLGTPSVDVCTVDASYNPKDQWIILTEAELYKIYNLLHKPN